MKWMLYALLAAATILAAPERTDVGKLQAIEIVVVSNQDDMVMIETDTGDTGKGNSIEEALTEMKETSSGIVLLDTAEYLLIEKGTEGYLDELSQVLKRNIRVSYVTGEKDLEEASVYLNIHKPKMRINQRKTKEIEEILVFEATEKENQKKIKIMLDK